MKAIPTRRKCPTCDTFFNPSREEHVYETVGANRDKYFHKECYEKSQKALSKEDFAKIELIKAMRMALKIPDESPTPKATIIAINRLASEGGYKFSGMLGTILYALNVKKMTITSPNIIPYIYEEARAYYAAQKANALRIQQFEGQTALTVIDMEVPKPKNGMPIKMRKEIDMGEI